MGGGLVGFGDAGVCRAGKAGEDLRVLSWALVALVMRRRR